jgi:uncharacterized membrane protein
MKKIALALATGVVAGGVDILPMVINKMDWYSISSAFIHWIALGIIIPYVSWKIASWVKGVVIAVITSLPVILIVAKEDVTAIPPMLIFSVILGALLGFIGNKLPKSQSYVHIAPAETNR